MDRDFRLCSGLVDNPPLTVGGEESMKIYFKHLRYIVMVENKGGYWDISMECEVLIKGKDEKNTT